MCGIGLLIAPAHSQADGEAPSLHRCWPSVVENISNRGPDCLDTLRYDFSAPIAGYSSADPWSLSLTSSVLSLRGDGVTAQPLTSSDGRLVLAWNGQIFDWDDAHNDANRASSSKLRLDSGENDAIILLDRIQQLLDENTKQGHEYACTRALNAALTQVEGPYAFVLLDRTQSQLYFGRDPLGRRSLLLHQSPQHSTIAIVSVASERMISEYLSDGTLTETDCSSLWTIDLLHDPTLPQPLPRNVSRFTSPLLLRELREPKRASTASDSTSPEQIREDFFAVLSESVRRRVTGINTFQPADEAHVAILFSGGLDCTTLALLADRHVPREQPIDLLNVAFENVRAIEAAKQERMKRLRAKVKGAKGKPGKGRRGEQVGATDQTGPDASVAAAQVAEQDAVASVDADEDVESSTNDIYAVPDRLTGRASYAELRNLCPHRRWNFISINVPYAEYTAHRSTVSTLIHPTSSVMDLSIACALYFASRARGHLATSTEPSYTSPARVLLTGLGADELLGGYSRHRQAYAHSDLAGLTSELQLDLDRLPTRNLGRDDRVLSHHAKEARYPYLDRSVLQFLTAVPVDIKVDLNSIATEGAGGDKKLLRDLAHSLGLTGASQLKKRAMQFGTRSAKIDAESRHVKGHHKLEP